MKTGDASSAEAYKDGKVEWLIKRKYLKKL